MCVFKKQEEGRALVSYVNKHLGYKINEFTLLTIINFSIPYKRMPNVAFPTVKCSLRNYCEFMDC